MWTSLMLQDAVTKYIYSITWVFSFYAMCYSCSEILYILFHSMYLTALVSSYFTDLD